MSNDIRKMASYLLPDPGGEVVRGMLDEIDDLRVRVAELEAALQPFTTLADVHDPAESGDEDEPAWNIDCFTHPITVGHLRAVRAALEGKG